MRQMVVLLGSGESQRRGEFRFEELMRSESELLSRQPYLPIASPGGRTEPRRQRAYDFSAITSFAALFLKARSLFGSLLTVLVTILSLVSGDALATQPRYINVPGHPFAAISSSDGHWLFVSINNSTNSAIHETSGIAVLHRNGNSRASLQRFIPLEPAIAGESAAAGMFVTHDGKLLVATHGEVLTFLDVERATNGHPDPVLGTLKTQEQAWNVYVNGTHDDKYLFVSNEGALSNLIVIDLKRARSNGFGPDSIVGSVPTGIAPVGSVFSPDEKLLYSTSAYAADGWGWPAKCKSEWANAAPGKTETPEGAIVIIDVETAKRDPANSVLGRVPAGCTPVRLDITRDGGSIWTTVRNADAVAAYDAAKLLGDPEHARIAWIPVGHAPLGIVITRDGKYVLNTNSGRFRGDADSPQTVTVIDRGAAISGSNAVIGAIKAGVFPRQLSLSPEGETIFVTNYLSNTVELLDAKHLPY